MDDWTQSGRADELRAAAEYQMLDEAGVLHDAQRRRELAARATRTRSATLPLTPAMRRALRQTIRQNLRVAGVLYIIGCGFVVWLFGDRWLRVIRANGAGLQGTLVLGLLIALIWLVIAALTRWSMYQESRYLRGGTFARTEGIFRVTRTRTGGNLDSGTVYYRYDLTIGGQSFRTRQAVWEAAHVLNFGTVDYAAHARDVIEIRDRAGTVVYRMPGYQPAA